MKTNIKTIAFGFLGMFLFASLAQADVVTQYSFENNLEDTAPSGVSFDNLSAAAMVGPLSTVYVPGVMGIGGQAVQIGSAPGDATVLSVGDSNDLDLAPSFTVEAFVLRTIEHGAEWDRFATKWFDGSNNWHWAFRGPPNKSQDLFMNGAQQINQGAVSADVGLDQWYHVAMTGDPANGLRLWQDGVVVGTSAYVAPVNGTDSFRIGNFNAVNQAPLQFHGYVDEFMIHDVSQDAAYMIGRTALIDIPEPSSVLLAAMAAMGFGLTGLRRRRRAG